MSIEVLMTEIDENEIIAMRLSIGEWYKVCDALAKVDSYMAGGSHDDISREIRRDLALRTMELEEFRSKVERRIRHYLFD